MAKKYDVWFSFGVTLELDDPEDYSKIARMAKQELVELINSDSIAGNIEDVERYDDRENPCSHCDEGEMKVIENIPMESYVLTRYECDKCGKIESFP